MKYNHDFVRRFEKLSPSMRREWIEMQKLADFYGVTTGLPPCGGSGLKFVVYSPVTQLQQLSPSMRREWIEICVPYTTPNRILVSLHAEGVD